MAGDRAKDILSELKPRLRLGEKLLSRVGARAWARARVAVSARIFKVYRLQDPWDPDSPADGIGNGLGPLSQRLAEDRRQPAPHAVPKEEKKPGAPKVPPAKAGPAPAAEPPRPPPAQNRTPTTSPPPRSAEPAAPRVSAATDADGKPAFGYIPKTYEPKKGAGPPPPRPAPPVPTANPFGRPDRPGLVGKLPMRPEVTAPAGPAAPTVFSLPVHPPRNSGNVGGRAEVARTPPAPAPARTPPAPARTPPAPAQAPPATRSGGGPTSASPVPRPSTPKSPGRLALGAATVVAAEPHGTLEVIELSPTPVAAPVAAAAADRSPPVEVAEAPPKAAPKPVNRSPPKGGGDSFDDFFASSLDAGRLRMGKAKATAVATAVEPEDKPKRVPVALPKAALPPGLPKPKADEPG